MAASAVSIKPPAVQGDVLSLYMQGTSKRSIAKTLGIDRATVDRILKQYRQTEPIAVSRVKQLVPKAYNALEKGLDAPDAISAGRLGLDLLKLTDLAPATGSTTINFERDVTLNSLTALLPAQAAQPEPIQAAKNPPVDDPGLSLHTNFPNFSAFSTAELEAELARRRQSEAIDVTP